MKSRRLALVNRSKNPPANGRGFNWVVVGNSENLSLAAPFSALRLADNSNSPPDNNTDHHDGFNGGYGPPDNNNDYYGGFNDSFNPSTTIMFVLVGVFLFVGCFSIFCTKYMREEESLRRGARGAIVQARRQNQGNNGLYRAVIESFLVFSYDLMKGLKTQTKETLECAACLSEFGDDEQLRLLPKCGHAFHPYSIDLWLFSHTTCPACRTDLVPTDDAKPTGTGYRIIELPKITPPEEVAIVVDGARNGSVRMDNDVETPVAPESVDSKKSLSGLGPDQGKKFRRS